MKYRHFLVNRNYIDLRRRFIAALRLELESSDLQFKLFNLIISLLDAF